MQSNSCFADWVFKLLAPENITVWGHAAKYINLDKKVSSFPGYYNPDLNPMLNVIMHLLGQNSRVEKIILSKGTQCGGTLVVMLFVTYIANNSPDPTMIVVSDEDERDEYSKKLRDVMECCEGLSDKLDAFKNKSKLELIQIPGSQIHFSTATVARSLRGKHVRNLILSETSNFVRNCQGQGDPFAIALKRLDTYHGRKKIYAESTPTDVECNIDRELKRADHKLTMYWACPHCGHYQSPDFFRDMRWEEYEREDGQKVPVKGSIHLACQNPTCSVKKIDEQSKIKMLQDFKLGPIPWLLEEIEASKLSVNLEKARTHRTDHKSKKRVHRTNMDEDDLMSFEDLDHLRDSVGIWYNPIQTPYGFKAWEDIVKNFLLCQKSPEEEQPFWNNDLGRSYDGTVSQTKVSDLAAHIEDYSINPLPKGVHLLTAGVDVNGSWISVEITGWGRNKESWTIQFTELEYDPSGPLAWQKLDEVLKQQFTHSSGEKVRISAVAIDSGYLTQQVAGYVRKHMGSGRNIIAIKGSATVGRPIIDKTPKEYKKNINLTYYTVGSNTAKDTLAKWFQVKSPGPCYCHFGAFLPSSYFEGLASEKLQVIRKTTGVKRVWVKVPGVRNEPLDVRCYSLAALEYLLQVKNLDDICAVGERKYLESKRKNRKAARAS